MWQQLDRASWLMRSKDSFVDSVADNLLDRLEVKEQLLSVNQFCLSHLLASLFSQ